MFIYSYDVRPDAVKNLVVNNLNNKVFSIAFDTAMGHEVFQGTDRKKVVEDAALRIKRVCHIR